MRFAIVDDEEVFRSQIEKAIYKLCGPENVACYLYADGKSLLTSIGNGNRFDAIFLDIEMEEIDGMSTARTLRDNNNNTPIIFITSHTEMAMDGYDVAAFRFLGKPIDPERLKVVLRDLEQMLYKETSITVQKDGENIIIPISSIQYVESMDNDVIYHLWNSGKSNELQVRGTLSSVFEKLVEVSTDFYKIHRCTIVNLKNVKRYSATDVTMECGTKLTIAKSIRSKFRLAMFDFVKKSGHSI
ncbi:MAG: LytTR family DNA-binding domain-containing protein [Clostridia bacterium]|nr:LytTR family DNA-binding domain-containing protein [Clostridia bacterium]